MIFRSVFIDVLLNFPTGVLYLKVVNPYKASYGVEDAEFAITQLAQTTMRSVQTNAELVLGLFCREMIG